METIFIVGRIVAVAMAVVCAVSFIWYIAEYCKKIIAYKKRRIPPPSKLVLVGSLVAFIVFFAIAFFVLEIIESLFESDLFNVLGCNRFIAIHAIFMLAWVFACVRLIALIIKNINIMREEVKEANETIKISVNDMKEIRFEIEGGAKVDSCRKSDLGKIKYLQVDSFHISLHAAGSEQAIVCDVSMEAVVKSLWERKIALPDLKQANIICNNRELINEYLLMIGKSSIPEYWPSNSKDLLCFWAIHKSYLYDRVCVYPNHYDLKTFREHIRYCIYLVFAKNGETSSTQAWSEDVNGNELKAALICVKQN